MKNIDFSSFFNNYLPDKCNLEPLLLDFYFDFIESDQVNLFNTLIKLGYNPQLAERTYKENIEFFPVEYNWFIGHLPPVPFLSENAVYTLLLVLLSEKYDVGLTVVRNSGFSEKRKGDGGFDIVLRDKDTGDTSVILDIKSGTTSCDDHVSFLKEMGCPLYRVIIDPDNEQTDIGSKKNYLDFQRTQVADITLRHLLCNLSFLLTEDFFNKELLDKKKELIARFHEILNNIEDVD